MIAMISFFLFSLGGRRKRNVEGDLLYHNYLSIVARDPHLRVIVRNYRGAASVLASEAVSPYYDDGIPGFVVGDGCGSYVDV